jgi:hypothetical protein
MSLKEQFVGAFESIFLAAIMIWSIGIAVALVSPQTQSAPRGTVEIYSLVSADS